MRDYQAEAEAYHADHEWISSSMVSDWIELADPREWAERYVQNKPQEPEPRADHFILGDLIHLAVIDRAAFNRSVAVIPRGIGHKGTANYKDWLARVAASNGRSIIIDKDRMETIRTIHRAVQNHPIAGAFLRSNRLEFETETRWDCPAIGVKLKIKPDIYLPSGRVIIDIKTTRLDRPDVDQFYKEAIRFGYHRSGFLQTYVKSAETGCQISLAYLVISTKAPFRIYVHAAGDEYLDRGRLATLAALEEIASHQKTGIYTSPQAEVRVLGPEPSRKYW